MCESLSIFLMSIYLSDASNFFQTDVEEFECCKACPLVSSLLPLTWLQTIRLFSLSLSPPLFLSTSFSLSFSAHPQSNHITQSPTGHGDAEDPPPPPTIPLCVFHPSPPLSVSHTLASPPSLFSCHSQPCGFVTLATD